MRKWYDWILALTPRYWLMNHPYSDFWDAELRQLMLTEKFTGVQECTAKIGPHGIWIANHPYASFTPYPKALEVRPSRTTIVAARRKLVMDAIVEGRKAA